MPGGLTLYTMIGTYITFCIIVAFLGRHVAVGFWGVFILCLFLTPFVPAILILLFKPKPKVKSLEDL